jgi:hypothetical protein
VPESAINAPSVLIELLIAKRLHQLVNVFVDLPDVGFEPAEVLSSVFGPQHVEKIVRIEHEIRQPVSNSLAQGQLMPLDNREAAESLLRVRVHGRGMRRILRIELNAVNMETIVV